MRRETSGGGAVTELAELVETPAVDPSSRRHAAGVSILGAYLPKPKLAEDPYRSQTSSSGAVTEDPKIVPPPALSLFVTVDTTRVVYPRTNLGKTKSSSDWNWCQSLSGCTVT
jgi:hypothetical protein